MHFNKNIHITFTNYILSLERNKNAKLKKKLEPN